MRKYIVDPFYFFITLSTSLFSLAIGLCLIYLGRVGSAAVFLLIFLVFLLISTIYGARITVDESGVSRSFPSLRPRKLTWDEIAEVGVAGTRVFKKENSSSSGAVYIYFSTTHMTDEERFDMILGWPPKDKLFMVYTKPRLDEARFKWGKKIQIYNAKDLHL